MSNFKKIRPVGAKLFHADGQTDITKPIAASRNLANASKKTQGLKICLFSVATKQAVLIATDMRAIQYAADKRHRYSSIQLCPDISSVEVPLAPSPRADCGFTVSLKRYISYITPLM
jgi:hypothetical protein